VRTPKDVTDAELAVMQVLWQRGPAAIREITEVLYPQDVEIQYSTVKRLLSRLEAKGFVRRDRREAVHRFHTIVDRDDLVGRRLKGLADSLCGGSISPLLTQLAQSHNLTDEQRRGLLALIEELKEPERPGGDRRKGNPG
jgi:BlaI family transcriptional regulator, penicillinase repressor